MAVLLLGMACFPALVATACAMAFTGDLAGGRSECVATTTRRAVVGLCVGVAMLCAAAASLAADGREGLSLVLALWTALSLGIAAACNRGRCGAALRRLRRAAAVRARIRDVAAGRTRPGSTGREIYDRSP